ncbi:hypothetical protein RQP46_006822 [Phenoliferia psychrophenolica]
MSEATAVAAPAAHDVQLEKVDSIAASTHSPPSIFTRLRARPKWLAVFFAEVLAAMCYSWAGNGATAAFLLSSAASKTGYGNLMTVGLAFGIGALLAIIIAGPVSGAHLSPSFSFTFALLKGFPWKKVPLYILAQIFGAFLGSLLVYQQYRTEINAATDAFRALGGDAAVFSPTGPAGIFTMFPTATQNLSIVFFNELVATTFLSLLVFSVLDSTNIFVSFVSAPFLVALAYTVCIWGFAPATIALNTSRDFGGRMAAAAIFNSAKPFTMFPKYTAIATLTNFLGTILGAIVHLVFIEDPSRAVVLVHPSAAPIPIGEGHGNNHPRTAGSSIV